jgi:uncharacterized protein YjeT (DUF2065 family)
MWRPFIESMVVEDGPIEMATAIFYLAGALFFWVRSSGRWWSPQRAAGVILLAGGMRELDLHNRVTSAYALNTRYFVNPNVPILERLIVVAILAGLGLVIVHFVKNGWKEFVGDLLQLETRALCIAGGVSLVVFTVGLDRFEGYLRRTFGPASSDTVFVLWVAEETLEMFIPLLFIAACPRRVVAAEQHSEKVAA